MNNPIVKMVSVHDELKRAQDAFYDAMFREDEEEMCAFSSGVSNFFFIIIAH